MSKSFINHVVSYQMILFSKGLSIYKRLYLSDGLVK